MHRLTNRVRPYSWGSTSAIPDLLGIPADGLPQAELWLGAHPDSPSLLSDGTRLDAAIDADPDLLVGAAVGKLFGPRLPYLLKVLSAAAPLSLQVHPNSEQAAAGFADEQERGVPQDADSRRYRDPFHKPEMVVALEPFDALCGWRDPQRTAELLARLDVEHPAWPHLRELVSTSPAAAALRHTVSWLLGGDEEIPSLVSAVAGAAAGHVDTPEYATAVALSEAYPEDPGVLVALLLNRVRLAPGEALFLPAGNIHAYLHGTALEVMASSDNVLRAGLTTKHVDSAELMRITDFTPRPLPVVVPEHEGPVVRYRPGAAEFELACVTLTTSEVGWHDLPVVGPRILLALHGELEVAVGNPGTGHEGSPTESVVRGTSLFISAASGTLAVRGVGAAVVAGVPAHPQSRR